MFATISIFVWMRRYTKSSLASQVAHQIQYRWIFTRHLWKYARNGILLCRVIGYKKTSIFECVTRQSRRRRLSVGVHRICTHFAFQYKANSWLWASFRAQSILIISNRLLRDDDDRLERERASSRLALKNQSRCSSLSAQPYTNELRGGARDDMVNVLCVWIRRDRKS